MSVIDSPRAKPVLGALWIGFFAVNSWLMFQLPGKETIPYHLIWVSFALLYGMFTWARVTTWTVFTLISVTTGVPLVDHAVAGVIGWEECSEIILMGVLALVLIWHVDRQHALQARLVRNRDFERSRASKRESAARFGSHEVRTRLTIARGFTELVRDSATDDLTRHDSDLILCELDKASALATQLLTLVRVQTASPRAHVQMVDLDELLDDVVHRWSSTSDRRWSCASRVGNVSGDAERIEAALDCLIENATKFTVVSDLIAVTALLEDDTVKISVRDSGNGIPQGDLCRVTELFQTGSTAGAHAGSGLGLSIAQAIVSERGGTLDVASTVGVGTCVTCSFPRERRTRRDGHFLTRALIGAGD